MAKFVVLFVPLAVSNLSYLLQSLLAVVAFLSNFSFNGI
ncbi:hypothetical protein B6254_1322 [Weissella cibaria]|uniref:Uncharacterized protein n=1 Tax=Weissella cibaria TaxID=137591 RepID=A0A2S1KRT8_9LACO|nr:hypothetical protein B6254_1322 [Weissella cibaria]